GAVTLHPGQQSAAALKVSLRAAESARRCSSFEHSPANRSIVSMAAVAVARLAAGSPERRDSLTCFSNLHASSGSGSVTGSREDGSVDMARSSEVVFHIASEAIVQPRATGRLATPRLPTGDAVPCRHGAVHDGAERFARSSVPCPDGNAIDDAAVEGGEGLNVGSRGKIALGEAAAQALSDEFLPK